MANDLPSLLTFTCHYMWLREISQKNNKKETGLMTTQLVWCYQSNTQPWKNQTLASSVPTKTKNKSCLNDPNIAFACSSIQKHLMICFSIVNACPGKLRTIIWWKYIFITYKNVQPQSQWPTCEHKRFWQSQTRMFVLHKMLSWHDGSC